jgi:hypothetical protein
MIRKSASELTFVNSNSPLPTVEVDAQSVDDAGFGVSNTVMQVLTRLAEQDPSLRATLYMYASISTNFHDQCWSEFLLVAGPKKVLQALGDGFKALPAVRSRLSDYIPSAMASRTFHVEDGLVWEREDASTWYSHAQTFAELIAPVSDADDDLDPPGDEDEDDEELLEDTGETDEEQAVTTVVQRAARYRAARADARVGTIRATIEQVFGLPAGSVALCGPDQRPLRGNALIKTLRRRWEDS